jgi:uncharacterized protein (TIRG00374 family)
LWFIIQAIVSVTLLMVLMRSLNLSALRELFVRLPLWFYGASLAVVLAGQVVYAWRWRLLLAAAGVSAPFSLVLRQYFIGIFLNNFFPSTVGGDVAKVYLLGRKHGYRPVTASVLLDRILGLGLLALCATVVLWSVSLPSAVLIAARLAVTAIAAASIVVLLIAAVGTGGLPNRLSWLGPGAVALAERIQRLRFDMAASLNQPALVAQAFAVVAGYFIAVGAVYVGFIDMQRAAAPPLALTTGIAMTIALLSNIPISLNGLGLREQLHATLLLPLGVAPEAAVALSLLLYGHLVVASLIGLVFWSRMGFIPDVAPPYQSTR